MRRVLKRAADAVPIVVGVSSPGFAAMSELAKQAMDAGAAGVMIAPPPHLRTDAQIVEYFQSAAESLGPIPFVLQDFPLTTGVQISPSTLTAIFDTVPTCVVLKHEDWPGLEKDHGAAPRRGERRPAAPVDSVRQRRRIPAGGTRPRRGRRDDGLRLPRDDGRGLASA